MSESPVIPLTWFEVFRALVAGILGWSGALTVEWIKKRRSPVEDAKTEAETRQIHVSTDLSLLQAATDALAKACRLQDERDHWQRKAESLEKQNDLLNLEVISLDNQMRRMDGFIKGKGWHLSDLDKPGH